jgi:hypothetical protein
MTVKRLRARQAEATRELLAHVALGGLYGAALFIARSSDANAARADVDAVLDALVGGLRKSISAR